MNKIEAFRFIANNEEIESRRFNTAPRAFILARTNARVLPLQLDTTQAYIAQRFEDAYDRMMCTLADIESLMARYETMSAEDQELRLVAYSTLVEARADTLTSIGQASALVTRVYTHLFATLDSEYTEEEVFDEATAVKGNEMSVGSVDAYRSNPSYAMECAVNRHNARRAGYQDRTDIDDTDYNLDEDYTDEDYEALAEEDAWYEAEEAEAAE